MSVRKLMALSMLVLFLGAGVARAGLYDDEKKITSGDVMDLDYWHAKFYHMMLEAALKSHQPEYLVGLLARTQANQTMPGLIKKYPKHEELKKWLAQYEDVDKQVDKNADRLAPWKPDFMYWDNEAYRQLWVNVHLGKMCADAKDWPQAASRYAWAADNGGKILDHEDWMKNWPEDIVKSVKDMKEEAEKQAKEMKKKA